MNIIEKYDKPFQYAGIALNIIMAYHFCMLWFEPTILDVDKLLSFISLIAFEFVMVHSGIFMSVMPKHISLFIMVPFYGVFAYAFNKMTDDNTILILYCVVVFNRMRFAFSDVSKALKTRVAAIAFSSMGVYFVFVFVILICSSYIPYLGLTPEFLKQSKYFDHTTATGEFIEKPHITMCFGLVYYLGLTMVEAYFLSWQPAPKKSKSTPKIKNF